MRISDWSSDVCSSDLLWVYEGQTSFWDLVLAARSGMQSKAMVLAEWSTHAGYYSVQPGREWRPVEDTTLDPVIAARKPKPFSIGRAHVWTPVTNAHLVCRLLLEKHKKTKTLICMNNKINR